MLIEFAHRNVNEFLKINNSNKKANKSKFVASKNLCEKINFIFTKHIVRQSSAEVDGVSEGGKF